LERLRPWISILPAGPQTDLANNKKTSIPEGTEASGHSAVPPSLRALTLSTRQVRATKCDRYPAPSNGGEPGDAYSGRTISDHDSRSHSVSAQHWAHTVPSSLGRAFRYVLVSVLVATLFTSGSIYQRGYHVSTGTLSIEHAAHVHIPARWHNADFCGFEHPNDYLWRTPCDSSVAVG
jgi:hypothetical protein